MMESMASFAAPSISFWRFHSFSESDSGIGSKVLAGAWPETLGGSTFDVSRGADDKKEDTDDSKEPSVGR